MNCLNKPKPRDGRAGAPLGGGANLHTTGVLAELATSSPQSKPTPLDDTSGMPTGQH